MERKKFEIEGEYATKWFTLVGEDESGDEGAKLMTADGMHTEADSQLGKEDDGHTGECKRTRASSGLICSREVACEADAMTIMRETERTRPEAAIKQDFEAQVERHKKLYPGGTLPGHLRDWDRYWEGFKRRMSTEVVRTMRCQFCGQAV